MPRRALERLRTWPRAWNAGARWPPMRERSPPNRRFPRLRRAERNGFDGRRAGCLRPPPSSWRPSSLPACCSGATPSEVGPVRPRPRESAAAPKPFRHGTPPPIPPCAAPANASSAARPSGWLPENGSITLYDPLAGFPEVEVRSAGERAALLQRIPVLGQFAALGPRVIVVHDGTVYKFGPDPLT